MRIRRVALCLCLGLTPSLVLTARAATLLQDEGGLGQSAPVALNASGQSVGYSATATGYDAVLWSPLGAPTLLQDAGGEGDSGAVAINASGWSVGSSRTANGQDAVLWSPAGTSPSFTVLQDAGGQGFSAANAINASGWSVGYSKTMGGQDAVLWSPPGTSPSFAVLPNPTGTVQSDAVAINNAGESVGFSCTTKSCSGQEAVLWSSGTAKVLPDVAGAGVTHDYQAVAINNSGWIIGNSEPSIGAQDAVLWTPAGTAIKLHDQGGMGFSDVVAINASGWSVGYSETPTLSGANFPSYEAVLWSPKGKATVLTDPGTTEGYAYAVAINDRGWSVGYFESNNGGPEAVLWSPTGAATKLGAALGSDWINTYGVGINDLSEVVGLGEYIPQGYGQYGFLLTVPELSTWTMLIVGFAGLGAAGYRAARKGSAIATV